MNNYKEKLTNKLKQDLNRLVDLKLDQALQNDNDTKYRNLVKTASEIILLLEKTEYEQMYSVWRNTDGERFLTVWLQNGDMDIKNEKVFKICEDDYNNKPIKMDFNLNTNGNVDLDVLNKIEEMMKVFYTEQMVKITNELNK